MTNELDEISSTKPTQDTPIDHAETQPRVNIQVPNTVNAEHSNTQHCCFRFCRLFCYGIMGWFIGGCFFWFIRLSIRDLINY